MTKTDQEWLIKTRLKYKRYLKGNKKVTKSIIKEYNNALNIYKAKKNKSGMTMEELIKVE